MDNIIHKYEATKILVRRIVNKVDTNRGPEWPTIIYIKDTWPTINDISPRPINTCTLNCSKEDMCDICESYFKKWINCANCGYGGIHREQGPQSYKVGHVQYKIPDKEDKIGVLLNSVIYYDVYMNPVWLPYLSDLRRYGDYSLHKYGELYILNDVYKDMGQVVSEIDNINKKIGKLEKAQWAIAKRDNSKAGQ
tara:strand:+ start:537 stop:1118 length:582 start_codon:yes stop_codon:yes gene_type:complete